MKVIQIIALDNGAHRNQTIEADIQIPDGWAVIPEDMVIPETFPFVNLTTENGMVTVMTAGTMPEPEPTPAEPEEPTTEADMLETILDHEARLSALELGGGED